MRFKFRMVYNHKTVAKGTASAAMTYEFQKAFWEGAAYARGGKAEQLIGKFATLDALLSRKVGENEAWVVRRPEEEFRFEAVRQPDNEENE